jgi:lipid-binding SYLF domain-containing protein
MPIAAAFALHRADRTSFSHLSKEKRMNRRQLLAVATATLALVGCTTTGGDTSNPATKRAEIDAAVDNAITKLNSTASDARELESKAVGFLVIPKVVSAGFVVGGSYGQGALREHGVTTGYYSVGSGSVGLLAGAETRAMYILFMTKESLDKFKASKGWTAGVDASVVVATAGANAQGTTQTAKAEVVGYVLESAGFMANLSLDGTKFNKLDL